MFAKTAISHVSKFQSIIALSTCKTKYIDMCEAEKEPV